MSINNDKFLLTIYFLHVEDEKESKTENTFSSSKLHSINYICEHKNKKQIHAYLKTLKTRVPSTTKLFYSQTNLSQL